ncbi:MAG TPA: hypothetical protein VHW66_04435 [Stellaceae bacterium]|jgi:hypothetical protein|nr:hypothetical protein [Stellaceae bacterium]
MAAPLSDLSTQQARIAGRLGRLFRFERGGRFARRPAETVWRLIARRATLMAELTGLERRRHEAEPMPSPELRAAVNALAGEVALSREYGETLVAGLGIELGARHGQHASSGLRDGGGGGRLLGSG